MRAFLRAFGFSLALAGAAAAQTGKHILYRVSGSHGATMYLLGSVHLLTPDAATLPPVVDSAFAHSKVLVLETSLDSIKLRAPELLAKARYTNGATLHSSLSPAAVPKVDSILHLYGLSIAQLDPFKPWFAALAITQIAMQRAQFQADLGIDSQLNDRAHAVGKPVVGLEPVDFQLGIFDALPAADQESMLVHADGPDASIKSLIAIKNAWMAGDATALDSLATRDESASPTLLATLLTDRNRKWIPELVKMLDGKDDVLVVVGAGHLIGKDGVVALLRARGYRVEQL